MLWLIDTCLIEIWLGGTSFGDRHIIWLRGTSFGWKADTFFGWEAHT